MAPKPQCLKYENDDIERVPTFEKKGYRTVPTLYVNGTLVEQKLAVTARPNQTLLSFLRDTLHLTGTKLGCAEGGCGACTVMISKKERTTSKVIHFHVNACLMPVLAADGCHVTTVEGIGTVKNSNLHPIQQSMVDMHGSQCGFCTPGIIVSLYTLISNDPTVGHLEENLDGNLCRCTGYRPIWDAARALCLDGENTVHGPCGTSCQECPNRDVCEQDCNVADKAANTKNTSMCCTSSHDKMSQYKDTFLANRDWLHKANEMFPAELLNDNSSILPEIQKPLMVADKTEFHQGGTWFKPTSLREMISLMQEFEAYKIVIGNTEVGIEARFKHAVYPRLICPADTIHELFDFKVTTSMVTIGSCCPLSKIQHECFVAAEAGVALTRSLMPLHDMLRWFASSQIRNVACLAGNLVTASPISDMNPMLAAMGAKLTLSSSDVGGDIIQRTINVSDFFVKYRIVDLNPCELVERIELPILKDVFEYFKPFKQARRREDDISVVTAGMRIGLGIVNRKVVIDDVTIAFGGMGPTTLIAVKTCKVLLGAEFNRETFDIALEELLAEFSLPVSVPGGQAAYRMTLATSFLYKFYLFIVEELAIDLKRIKEDPSLFPNFFGDIPETPLVEENELCGTWSYLSEKKPSYIGVQQYPTPRVAKGLEDVRFPISNKAALAQAVVVGKASSHMSGPLHCTGEASYTDDIPLPHGTLHASLVLSTECGGVFESMDILDTLGIPGVVNVYSFADIEKLGGDNALGPIVNDELVFVPPGEKVRSIGQVLGVVVAETLHSAELGSRTVQVKYGICEEKIIVTIEDAIEAGSFYEFSRHVLERGDVSVLLELTSSTDFEGLPKNGDIIKVSGSCYTGPQEHFYLETQTTLVVPSESDTNLTVYSSTQAPTKTQKFCASATGTPAAKVVCRTKRMGGGFGGKETRSVFIAVVAAVAAKRSCRPVRLSLSRDVDMKISGTRHAFVSKYQASAQITEDGAKLIAFDAKLYANAGFAFDLSGPIVDRALFHVDNCYYYPHFRAEGIACKTSQPAHTAYRGFGAPQGMSIQEQVMDHLALACNVSGDTLRRTNMYKDGDHLPFGMIMGDTTSGKWNVPTMWDKLFGELDVSRRRSLIDDFNAKNKWTKRGLSFMPTKFGIAYTAKFMNQGGALVHVYTDATVLVTHGGTEMGQGLHTKVCQVAAQVFGIPLDDVYINDSSTDKVANSIPTAASMSTDTYGMATLDACRQILVRLEPIRQQLGIEATFKDVVNAAHFARIDLSAHGFYTVDDKRCGFFWDTDKPDDFPMDAPQNSWKGNPFNYFTQGVACSEVEIDVLTGNHKALRSDLIVDVGSSINPAIDIGQIEGAFIQGMGWSTMEEMVYACDDHTWIRPRGALFTTGPGTYKIPAFNDVPEIFNVTLMDNVDNPFAVHSSKAVGEPPFFLGASIFFAIKDAIRAARKQNIGTDEYFEMRMPASSERIRMYSADSISKKVIAMMMSSSSKVTTTTSNDDDDDDDDDDDVRTLLYTYQPQGTF